MEYILYCDESIDTDTKYGDFFGGCIISSSDLHPVVDALEKCKKENNLLQEIKWTKVTENYLQKYQNVIRLFFSFVRQGKIKVRIMFRSMENQYVSESKAKKISLTSVKWRGEKYFLMHNFFSNYTWYLY